MKKGLQKRVLIPLLAVTIFFGGTAFKSDFAEKNDHATFHA